MIRKAMQTLMFIIVPALFIVFVLLPLTPFVMIASIIRAVKEKDVRIIADDTILWFTEPDTYLENYLD